MIKLVLQTPGGFMFCKALRIFLTFVALGSISLVQEKPNFSGTWKLNVAKSEFGMVPPPTSETIVIEQNGLSIRENVSQDGQQGQQEYTVEFVADGKEVTIPADSPRAHLGQAILHKISASWQGSSLLTVADVEVQGLNITSKTTYTLSEDGKVLTGLTSILTTSMGNFNIKEIYEKESVSAGATVVSREDGKEVYRQSCASCHETGVPRAPNRIAMGRMSPENIRFALTKGSMISQGAKLSAAQTDALVRFLTDQASSIAPSTKQSDNLCPADSAPFEKPFSRPYWNGWGGEPSQHRFQSAEMAQLSASQVPKLKVKWAFGFPGVSQVYGQPAVAGGRVFVGSAGRKVYSLSADTGCMYWAFDTDSPVRTAISVGPQGQSWAIYFGDQHANAYAVDAITGKLLWKTHLEEHPAALITGAPTLAGNRLYVPVSSFEEATGADPRYECCKFRGSLSAIDVATGKIVWKSYTIAEEPKPVRKNKQGTQLWGPSGAAIWSSPTVDIKKHRVYVTTGDSYSDPAANASDSFIAFDSETGKLVWSQQMTAGDAFTVDCDFPAAMRSNCPEANGPDFDFGSSPILAELPNGHRALIAGQKSGIVYAVDPEQGKVLWRQRVGKGGRLGGVQWGSAADAKNVYVAVSDVEIKLAAQGTPGAQPTMFGVPMELDPKAGGGLFALKLETGEIAWQTPHPGCAGKAGCSPAQSAAVTAIPGVVFSGGLDGHLRAYSIANGQIVWDADTEREYPTVNGVKANGGSMDGPGAVVVGGVLFVSSGYAYMGHAPGNVLLAFSVDGK
jgi:polyvinyl alcohol dehydrogenase (cytochrome)